MSLVKPVVAGLAALCLAGCGTAVAGPPESSWEPCPAVGNPAGYECSTVQVPVDWGEPDGRTIALRIARLPSTDPAHQLGAVLFNPGVTARPASKTSEPPPTR